MKEISKWLKKIREREVIIIKGKSTQANQKITVKINENNNKQKKQNTQNIPIRKPEQTIRIMTSHAFQIFDRKKMAIAMVKGIILETDSENERFLLNIFCLIF